MVILLICFIKRLFMRILYLSAPSSAPASPKLSARFSCRNSAPTRKYMPQQIVGIFPAQRCRRCNFLSGSRSSMGNNAFCRFFIAYYLRNTGSRQYALIRWLPFGHSTETALRQRFFTAEVVQILILCLSRSNKLFDISIF